MLAVQSLSRPGLHPASFTLKAGECMILRGPSGSGKTLLMRALADLDLNQGTVMLDERPREDIPAPEWRKRVAYVPAESGWWADRVGDHFENTAGLEPLLIRAGLADDALNWPVSRLSTGEKQRLALLRALAQSPGYLLLDEPTSALDETARELIEDLIRSEMASGTGVLLITHDADQAQRFGGRQMWMDAGTLSIDAP